MSRRHSFLDESMEEHEVCKVCGDDFDIEEYEGEHYCSTYLLVKDHTDKLKPEEVLEPCRAACANGCSDNIHTLITDSLYAEDGFYCEKCAETINLSAINDMQESWLNEDSAPQTV